MTTTEIQQYVDAAVSSKFSNYTSQSEEMMTSAGGDGRFLGKVFATKYSGLEENGDIFLAIGETEKQIQIVKIGRSESLKPNSDDLDLLLLKELGIEKPTK